MLLDCRRKRTKYASRFNAFTGQYVRDPERQKFAYVCIDHFGYSSRCLIVRISASEPADCVTCDCLVFVFLYCAWDAARLMGQICYGSLRHYLAGSWDFLVRFILVAFSRKVSCFKSGGIPSERAAY